MEIGKNQMSGNATNQELTAAVQLNCETVARFWSRLHMALAAAFSVANPLSPRQEKRTMREAAIQSWDPR